MFPRIGIRDAAPWRATVPLARQLICSVSSSRHCSKEGTWWFRKYRLLCCHKLTFLTTYLKKSSIHSLSEGVGCQFYGMKLAFKVSFGLDLTFSSLIGEYRFIRTIIMRSGRRGYCVSKYRSKCMQILVHVEQWFCFEMVKNDFVLKWWANAIYIRSWVRRLVVGKLAGTHSMSTNVLMLLVKKVWILRKELQTREGVTTKLVYSCIISQAHELHKISKV